MNQLIKNGQFLRYGNNIINISALKEVRRNCDMLESFIELVLENDRTIPTRYKTIDEVWDIITS